MFFLTNAESGLLGILEDEDAAIPGHVPGGIVPKIVVARLQRSYVIKNMGHDAVFGFLPCGVSLNPKNVGNGSTKATERGDEVGLPDAFAEREIQFGGAKLGGLMLFFQTAFQRQTECTKCDN